MNHVSQHLSEPRLVHPEAATRLLLVCDHATNHIPAEFGQLGLSAPDLARHIAWDPGAEAVTRRLSSLLSATAVLAPVSRLVIDCNRALKDPSSICETSDGIIVPGNQGLGCQAAALRADSYFHPYHAAIDRQLRRLDSLNPAVTLVAIHSFTASMGGIDRPWQLGILWNDDPRLAIPMIELLRAQGLDVGNNEPYSGRESNYTADCHAGNTGRCHVSVEIRQNLLTDDMGVVRWADLLAHVLARLLALPLRT
jgi:predicted N-formylglutamate amidohydrolase